MGRWLHAAIRPHVRRLPQPEAYHQRFQPVVRACLCLKPLECLIAIARCVTLWARLFHLLCRRVNGYLKITHPINASILAHPTAALHREYTGRVDWHGSLRRCAFSWPRTSGTGPQVTALSLPPISHFLLNTPAHLLP